MADSTLAQLLEILRQQSFVDLPRPQIYFKASLTALSHALEDLVFATDEKPLLIASFQRERFYRQEAHRYERLAHVTSAQFVLAAAESRFADADTYPAVAFPPSDPLALEWNLVVIGPRTTGCLICLEKLDRQGPLEPAMDTARRFEGIWTTDRRVVTVAAQLLLERIAELRPDLQAQTETAIAALPPAEASAPSVETPFAERLLNYLQAGQYKLLKAYRAQARQTRKEQLINTISSAVRQSLNPEAVLEIAARELGLSLAANRCLIYACTPETEQILVEHEYRQAETASLGDRLWPLQENPLFQQVATDRKAIRLTVDDPEATLPYIKAMRQQWDIAHWLLIPVQYRQELIGMIELHREATAEPWELADQELAEAIATQIGVALIQAQTFRQLENLERTRSNLTAIIGHELRTPLSTVQVCLESLASEPDMSADLRQVMLQTALDDAERLRLLVQDFLTLSRLESGRIDWHPESLALDECVAMAMSGLRSRHQRDSLPSIEQKLPASLPLVRVDGDWLVEVLIKLLDNACKFTSAQGHVSITAVVEGDRALRVAITDDGRGIEPDRLEAVFDRFYQEDGALRRSQGGSGLGLAICRQIVERLGGHIWAESEGRDRGTRFQFTLPLATRHPQTANALT
ncbi:DICT sensory domain-containing protein [Synechococcus elongatus]|uniref:histidine kinase n=1 Tax=Synechococcus elongatus PCC 11801 TaxID=2219813 RepID=A0AAN1UU09_SYNEL|nr:DICT sensory domain-containing protein [Synechococcus elongatus]AZB72114.1 histidine kinase [Synechococcus elongatus PCC 11801]